MEMRTLKCVVALFVITITFRTTYGVSDCLLFLNKDYGRPAPVYLFNGAFLEPTEKHGAKALNQSHYILVSCPGRGRRIVLNNKTSEFLTEEASCIANHTFRMDRWVGEFRNISCSGSATFDVERTKERCAKIHFVYRVGFHIWNKFHTLYKACFDESRLATLYVKHTVSPGSLYQQSGNRPQFVDGPMFHKVRMSNIYKKQKERIRELLGPGMDEAYITKNQFLSRGHLAPRADFPFEALQRATFHYINTAPQWQRGNAGDWAALEDAIRRRAASGHVSLTVYTGTSGTLTLASASGRYHPIHLTVDRNNNEIVPVPLYFYKVVYEPRQKKAVAFISINSSYYNNTQIRELSFCRDICYGSSQYGWIRWRSDGTHSFCCTYEDFIKKVHDLPALDVKGLFY